MEAVLMERNSLRGSLRRPSQLDTSGGLGGGSGGSPVPMNNSPMSSSLRRGFRAESQSPFNSAVSPVNGGGVVHRNSVLNTSLRMHRSDSITVRSSGDASGGLGGGIGSSPMNTFPLSSSLRHGFQAESQSPSSSPVNGAGVVYRNSVLNTSLRMHRSDSVTVRNSVDASGGLGVGSGGSPVPMNSSPISSSLRRGFQAESQSPSNTSPVSGAGVMHRNSVLNTSLRMRRSDSMPSRASGDLAPSRMSGDNAPPSPVSAFNPLTKLAEHGDMAGVRNLLDITPADTWRQWMEDGAGPVGTGAVHAALQYGHIKILEYLLSKGGAITLKRPYHAVMSICGTCTTASVASADRLLPMYKWLWEHEPKTRGGLMDNDLYALHFACQTGRIDLLEWLLERGVPVNQADASGSLPLSLVLWAHRIDMADVIFNRGQGASMTGVHFAAYRMPLGSDEQGLLTLDWLAKHGYDKKIAETGGLWAGHLLEVVEAGHIKCFDWLLDVAKVKVDFSKASDRGGEALNAAMRRGRLHILESIKKRHPRAVGKLHYWTALEKERRGTMRKDDRGVLLFFTWLWDQGRRDVLVSGDWHGNTLLHKVAIESLPMTARWLCEHGVSPLTTNLQGESALDLAMKVKDRPALGDQKSVTIEVLQLWLQAHPPGQGSQEPAVALPCCCCLLLFPQPAASNGGGGPLNGTHNMGRSGRQIGNMASLRRVNPGEMNGTGDRGAGEGGGQEGPVQSSGLLDQSLRMGMGDAGSKTFRATVAQSEW